MRKSKCVSNSWSKVKVLDLEEAYFDLLRKSHQSNVSVEIAVESLVKTFKEAIEANGEEEK